MVFRRMMRIGLFAACVPIAGTFAPLACSSSSSGSGSGSGSGSSSGGSACSTPLLDGCLACIASECKADAQTACNQSNAFSNCYCACTSKGGGAAQQDACVSSCATSSCASSVSACASQASAAGGACASTCGLTGSGSSSGSGGSSGSSSGGGSCTGVFVACYHAPMPATGQGGVCQVVGPVPAAGVSAEDSLCTQMGGTAGPHCPSSADLVGCCVSTKGCSMGTTCVYATMPPMPSDVMAAQMQCLAANQQDAGGAVASWTTTPP